MSVIRKLASQTAIYGMSSILGRFLNYLLVPLHTSKSVFEPAQYGIITEMYAYVSFLVILLTYGMETAFFRYYSKGEYQKEKVFSTALWSLSLTTSVFILLSIVFSIPIADWLRYPNNSEYVIWFAIIVGLDALSSLPLAKLRAEDRPISFAVINLGSVMVNIGLNLFFLAYCLPKYQAGESNWLISTFYDPEIGVGYVFIANLVSSVFKFVLLSPWMLSLRKGLDPQLLRNMLSYGLPLLVAGMAGMINETIDRILLKRMLMDKWGEEATMAQVGIYGAVYKISIIITLFIQAFRYAAEPFFFAHEKTEGSGKIYSRVMNYFVIICAFIFLGVMLFIDIIKHFVPNEAYWVGLSIVPILLFANIFLGIYYNQSIWYKLSGHTRIGAVIAILGALITLTINLVFIPEFSYEASAWATLLCYGTMMVVSYLWSRKYYPIQYNLFRIGFYLVFSFLLYRSVGLMDVQSALWWTVRIVALLFFGISVYIIEKKDLLNYESKSN